MTYLPIEDHGIIGNMRTAALVGINGSIDWLCVPFFDSPSVFGAILDDRQGGSFDITPSDDNVQTKQFYWPETNVLVTRFLSPDGVGELEDFMPAGLPSDSPRQDQLFRRVRARRGKLAFTIHCRPAFDYARIPHRTMITKHGAVFETKALSLSLASTVPLVAVDEGGVTASFVLREGEEAVFVLCPLPQGEECRAVPSKGETQDVFEQTVEFWHRWLAKCTYVGRWREMVYRSALTLKLMTFGPSGAIVASPTCSLPEAIGGTRNWDYRYTWIRDAAFTLYGFLRIGFTEEAHAFMQWMDARAGEVETDGTLQIVYGVDGRHDLTEHTLDHLEGYRGSRPVRIGNGAYNQLQLDIFGELLDSLYLYNKHVMPIGIDAWVRIRKRLNWLCENWQLPDEGIWEVRGGRRQFVFSKLMCWVAMDRGVRLADKRSFPSDRERWQRVRDQIYEEIMAKGYSQKRQAFVQHYDTDTLDASNLIMPLVFFMAPNDPRMLNTLDAINRSPQAGGLVSDGLVYRYDTATGEDGLCGGEGTFTMCSFWLVEALTRAGHVDHGKLAEARLLFERMLGHSNHLGLYSEEIGPRGEALGNFPQAFTHLALISAAFNLDRTLGRKEHG
ncbi:Glycoside hydrolase [Nitrospira sp. KM1]|uniref:glycoside hydrolase family 15 protein n=1 Tax=Nitrospira sp. KM1 TaxID=1936990 RepID=UPI0013A72C29|nr:glycoside hydrolase family 15 protein [Nitrospira sp. KM1]BCA52928.1 Glycoside hydrolase [Nitrospira sp. KM1]